MDETPEPPGSPPPPPSETPQERLARALELLRSGRSVREASRVTGAPRSTVRRIALKAGIISPRDRTSRLPEEADGNFPYLRVEVEALEERVAGLESALEDVRRDVIRLRDPRLARALESLRPIEASSPTDALEGGDGGV